MFFLPLQKCKGRKKCSDKLVEKCPENIEEAKIAKMALFLHGNEYVCSYTICVFLTVTALAISIGLGGCFAYKYMNCNKENVSKYDYVCQATNY